MNRTQLCLSRILAGFAFATVAASAFAADKPPHIELVCCDLAGTTVDYGSVTPTIGFKEIFKRHSLTVTDAELSGPMGRKKDDHIREVLAIPGITAQWKKLHDGAAPTDADIAGMLKEFIELDREIIPKTSAPIPGVPEALASLQARGVKIAYTSGYPRVLMDLCLKNLRAAGAPVDKSYSADEVPSGRPAPHMLLRCLVDLNVGSVKHAIAIGDTESDINAGKNAGFITVGVCKSGMIVGLDPAAQKALPPEELAKRIDAAREKLFAYGADHVIDDVAALPALIADIESGKIEAFRKNR